MAIQRCEEIRAWQEARALAGMIHDALGRESFERDFALGDQLRRTTISVMANIAEGFSSQSNKEFIKFLYIALRSCSLVQSHLYLALDHRCFGKEQFDRLFQQTDLVSHLILGFIRYLKGLKRPDNDPLEEAFINCSPATHRPEPGTRNPKPETRNPVACHEAGFTLIELLVVIIIIGLLAALVGPKLFGRVGKGRQAAAQAQIELFGTALDNLRLDVGRYPTSAEGLRALLVNPGGVENWDGPYLKKQEIPADPWGHPYDYKSPGEHGDYDIISFGGDGVAGGDGENQDIVSWQNIKRAGQQQVDQ